MHRDVKPENIFLCKNNNENKNNGFFLKAKLGDLGFAEEFS
jgi:serine/threonine protein kinase